MTGIAQIRPQSTVVAESTKGSFMRRTKSTPEVEFGVYNPAGHLAAGGTLTLTGRVGGGDAAQAPPGIVAHDLPNRAGAEVHLAVTSHGELDPATLPNEFHIPTGFGGCGCWWVAIFD